MPVTLWGQRVNYHDWTCILGCYLKNCVSHFVLTLVFLSMFFNHVNCTYSKLYLNTNFFVIFVHLIGLNYILFQIEQLFKFVIQNNSLWLVCVKKIDRNFVVWPQASQAHVFRKKQTVNSWKCHTLCDLVWSYERNHWEFEHVIRNCMGNEIWLIYKDK